MQPFNRSPQDWNHLIARLPQAHLLQTWEWSQVKTKYGWQAMPIHWSSVEGRPLAAAMVLKRTIPVGGFARRMSVMYVPKGPLLDWNDAGLSARVLDDLQSLAVRQGAIFIKIDPDVLLGMGLPGSEASTENERGQSVSSDLTRRGWTFSQDQVQFRNTVLVDLTCTEQEMLRRMKQKTRYNVRLAEKKGVSVRIGTRDDLPLLFRMYAETSIRDGFVLRDEAYYRTVWETFMSCPAGADPSQPSSEPLIAEVAGQPVAAVSLFYFAACAYYLYGMSREAHREKMPNHLLQWEAMRRAKALGCTAYNLWGAPDEFIESDGLWGVFRFKEGFGGKVVRTLGAWDFPASRLLYKLYTQTLPRILDLMRSRGKARTRHSIGG